MVDLDKLVISLIEGEGSITRHDLIKALNEQGLILSYESSGYALAKKSELQQPFKVEKDKVYMCIKNFELADGTIAYIKGHLYKGDGRGCLQSEQGTWLGAWMMNGDKYFRLATEDEIPQPKFKVGDWICHCVYKKPLQIIEDLGGGDYRVMPNSIISAQEFQEHIFRHWNIQDAKDGDVLVDEDENYGDSIFIFRNMLNEETARAYVRLMNGEITVYQKDTEHGVCPSVCHPATKEERDFFFSKMSEKGYKWNVEKKVLEKVNDDITDVLEDAVTGILTTVDNSMSAAGIKRSITFSNTTPEQEKILKSIYDSWQQQS